MTTPADEAAPPRVRAKPASNRTVTSTAGSPSARALADLTSGLRRFGLWSVLGWSDIRQQYRRSTLGPLWITISMAAFVVFLGILYAQLFDRPMHIYMPHLAIGYILWNMISNFAESGSRCFINAEGIIKQLSAPLSVHVYRIIWSNLLTLAHHAIIIVAVMMVFGVGPSLSWFLVLPGLALILLTGAWVILLLGTLSARFRDIPQIVQTAMRMIFFMTPVLWMPEFIPRRAIFLTANPFHHYIELVRAPLLNNSIDPLHWQVAGALTILGWLVTFLLYRRFRQRVAYWL